MSQHLFYRKTRQKTPRFLEVFFCAQAADFGPLLFFFLGPTVAVTRFATNFRGFRAPKRDFHYLGPESLRKNSGFLKIDVVFLCAGCAMKHTRGTLVRVSEPRVAPFIEKTR